MAKMIRTLMGAVVGLVAVGLLATAQSALAATVYTSRGAWQTAVGLGYSTIQFSSPVSNATSITLPNGIVSTFVGTGTLVQNSISPYATIHHAYYGTVSNDGSLQLRWEFPHYVTAFGADFNGVNYPDSVKITGDFDGSGDQTFSVSGVIGSVLSGVIGTSVNGFFGVIGSAPFNSILFTAGTTSSPDTFTIDTLSLGPQVTAPIPLPPALALFLTGLGLVGAAAWRRRRAA